MSREKQLFDALEGAITLIDMNKAPDWFVISARAALAAQPSPAAVDHADKWTAEEIKGLAARGLQACECKICGCSAGAIPKPVAAEPVTWRVFIDNNYIPNRLRLAIGVQSFDIDVEYAEDEPGRLEWHRDMLTKAMLRVAPQPLPQERKPLTLNQLREKWNTQADDMNQWDMLGLDEIIEFAQADHGIKEGS